MPYNLRLVKSQNIYSVFNRPFQYARGSLALSSFWKPCRQVKGACSQALSIVEITSPGPFLVQSPAAGHDLFLCPLLGVFYTAPFGTEVIGALFKDGF